MSETNVRTFRASSMQAALDLVRRELGPDAVILHTRQLPPAPLLLRWRKRTDTVEITAGTGIQVRTPKAMVEARYSEGEPDRRYSSATDTDTARLAPTDRPGSHSATRPGSRPASGPAARSMTSPAIGPGPAQAAAISAELQRLQRQSPQPRQTTHQQFPDGVEVEWSAAPPTATATSSTRSAPPRAVPPESFRNTQSSGRNGMSIDFDSTHRPQSRPSTPPTTRSAGTDSFPNESGFHIEATSRHQAPVAAWPSIPPALDARMSNLEQMVSRIAMQSARQATPTSAPAEFPAEVDSVYSELIAAEVSPDLATELCTRCLQVATADELDDAVMIRERISRLVESDLHVAPPIELTPGRRRVVALVGPTGVGKTTTIAKLAANFRLQQNARMGLVTVDTYRIAAVEQLRTYAEIIDLPMRVVTTPDEMRRSLDEFADMDLVLIDTAGRSPRDELKIQELQAMLQPAAVDEVHLVLSAVSQASSLISTAENFAPAGITAMVLTKLDELPHLGGLLSIARDIPLPVSYLTTGQDVPDDIEQASARRIARLLTGRETLPRSRRRPNHR